MVSALGARETEPGLLDQCREWCRLRPLVAGSSGGRGLRGRGGDTEGKPGKGAGHLASEVGAAFNWNSTVFKVLSAQARQLEADHPEELNYRS